MSDIPRPSDTFREKSSDTLRDKLSETRHNIAEMGTLAKEAVQEKYQRVKERASEKYEEGKEKLHEFEENLTRKVRNAPMQSVLIAAGVGLVLGFICRRS